MKRSLLVQDAAGPGEEEMMETTERKSIKKVLREQLDSMQEIFEEMGRTNVVNYALKPHILRRWVEGLREVHQAVAEALEQAEESVKKRDR